MGCFGLDLKFWGFGSVPEAWEPFSPSLGSYVDLGVMLDRVLGSWKCRGLA